MLFWAWVRHQWTLWELIKNKRSVQKGINTRYRHVDLKEMSTEEREKMIDDVDRERVPIEEDITGAIVSYLFELAYHYRVPTPDFAELEPWKTSVYTGRRQLTAKALAEFRKTIRDEQKERWQFWELRAKMLTAFVTGFTGAIGTLIGLIAIWGK
jgi:hypothetical protein